MNKHVVYFGFAIAGLVLSPIGYAEELTDDGLTVVVDETETPEDVASTLPDAASDAADQHSAFGQGVASQAKDQAREMRRLFGEQVSQQARDAHADGAAGHADSHRP